MSILRLFVRKICVILDLKDRTHTSFRCICMKSLEHLLQVSEQLRHAVTEFLIANSFNFNRNQVSYKLN